MHSCVCVSVTCVRVLASDRWAYPDLLLRNRLFVFVKIIML